MHREDATGRPTRRARRAALRLVRAHPVAALLAWSATVGQAVLVVPLLADPARAAEHTRALVVVSTLVGLALPALLVTRLADGPDGLRALGRSLVRLPGTRWTLLAVAGVPATAVGLTAVLTGPPSGPVDDPVGLVLGGLVLPLVAGLVTVNLAEEAAWTGVVQSRLAERHGPLGAAAVTGPLFALQHAALLAGGSVAGTAVLLALLALLAVPFRVLTGWVHARTGSVLAVGVLHASGNAVASTPGGLLARLHPGEGVTSVAHLLALALLGALVLAATRGRLRHRPGAPPRPAPGEAGPVRPTGGRT